MWLALVVFVGRYALRPLWRRRPLWLRGFATEEEELGLKDGRFPAGRLGTNGTNGSNDSNESNDSNDSNESSARANDDSRSSGDGRAGEDEDIEAAAAAVEIAVEGGAEEAVESDSDNSTEDSSEGSTVVGFGRRNSVVDVRPVSIGGGFATLNIRSWHLMTVSLFLLSVTGVATSLILTFAAGHGYLYLTPLVPCVCAKLLILTPTSFFFKNFFLGGGGAQVMPDMLITASSSLRF